jgi:hypothetical protein
VGTRAVLDAVVKRKIPSPRRESNSRTPIVQSVAQCYKGRKNPNIAPSENRNADRPARVLVSILTELSPTLHLIVFLVNNNEQEVKDYINGVSVTDLYFC